MAQFNATFTNGFTFSQVSKTREYGFAYRVEFVMNDSGRRDGVVGFSATRENAVKAANAHAARIGQASNVTIVFNEVVATTKV